LYQPISSNDFRIFGNSGDRVTVTSTGSVGIGTTSPGSALEINAAAATSPFIAKINTAEVARIDSSGRLLVGTSTTRSNLFAGNSALPAYHLVEGALDNGRRTSAFVYGAASNSGPLLVLAAHASNSVGGVTAVTNDWEVGIIDFQGADGTNFVPAARIAALVDGTPGANDMPGRLVFSVTADGAASPTEALRISNNRSITVSDGGNVVLGTSTGTKIGTATTQKIGFFDKTPVVQPTAVADATDAASAITQLNALLTRMRNLGLIAT
jgi:hypothetical protein